MMMLLMMIVEMVEMHNREAGVMVMVIIMVMDYYDVVARALLEMSKHFLGPFIRELYFGKFFHKKIISWVYIIDCSYHVFSSEEIVLNQISVVVVVSFHCEIRMFTNFC